MGMIDGIGDEVTWFAVVTLLAIVVLSVSYLWRIFVDQSASLVRRPTSSPNEDLHGTANSAAGEGNQAGGNLDHDGNLPANDTTDGRVDDNVGMEELNSGEENGHEVVVPKDSVDKDTAEPETSRMGSEDLQQDSSSATAVKRAQTNENSSNVAPNTNCSVRNVTDSPSTTLSETELSYSDQIRLRLKYLNDMERTVSTRLSKNIADFKREHFSEELAANKTVRLIFNGQLLRNEVTLQHCGISDGCVVHVHISQSDPQHPPASVESHVDLDLSHLLWPLLSVILVLLWILYFRYPQFFNVTSTGILLIFTGGFIFVYGESRLQAHN